MEYLGNLVGGFKCPMRKLFAHTSSDAVPVYPEISSVFTGHDPAHESGQYFFKPSGVEPGGARKASARGLQLSRVGSHHPDSARSAISDLTRKML